MDCHINNRSSFCGSIEEICGIAVDNFENEHLKARAFFLSHCHSDHIQGLFSKDLTKALCKSNAYIYMSKLSYAIICDETQESKLVKHLKILDLGTNHIKLPKSLQCEEEYIDVVTIPAGHCLGSFMFLFKTKHKNILYTGDFRIRQNDVNALGHLHKDGEAIKIDTMYVDTTFINIDYTSFPKRKDSVKNLVGLIRNWLNQDKNNCVALNTSAKYGYEFLFKQIFENLLMKVFVNEERWKFYRDHPEINCGVTNNEEETRIHCCRDMNENGGHFRCNINLKNGLNFLFVRLSALLWKNFNTDDSNIDVVSKHRINVCFATHCSRSELLYFVHYFSPKKTIGFPNEFVDTKILKRQNTYDSGENKEGNPFKRKNIFLPKTTNAISPKRKLNKILLKNMFDL